MKLFSTLYFLLLFFFSLVLTGCTDESATPAKSFFPTQSSDTLLIETGFPSTSRTFTHEGKAYTYFFDLITLKKVKLYDEKFNWIKTVSLDQFEDLGLYMIDMEMITPDSVLILTDYTTNTLISYNLKTLKQKQVDLNQLIPMPELKPSLEFYSSAYSGFRFNKGVILEVKASQAALLALNPEIETYPFLKLYDSINKSLPHSIYIENPFSETPKVQFIERSKNFVETFGDAFFNTLSHNFLEKNRVINTTVYMNYFDFYNVANNKTEKKEVRSQFTDIGMPPRKWADLDEDPSLVMNTNITNEDYRNAGKVNRIFYDKKNKRYHVFVLYSKAKVPKTPSNVSPFIWQVYDKNFKLLDEREHNPTDLVCGTAFVSGAHIYVHYYNEKTFDQANPVYIRFDF